jgi:hypothetical protein
MPLTLLMACFSKDLVSLVRKSRGEGKPPPGRSPALGAVKQLLIGQYERHHGFHHGRTPYADAGVMAALGDNLGGRTLARYRFNWG